MVKSGKAYRYSCWCVESNNRKVGKYIKKQARAWIDIVDGKDPEAYVDEDTYEKVCNLLKLSK